LDKDDKWTIRGTSFPSLWTAPALPVSVDKWYPALMIGRAESNLTTLTLDKSRLDVDLTTVPWITALLDVAVIHTAHRKLLR
jgi:hypothetical protein